MRAGPQRARHQDQVARAGDAVHLMIPTGGLGMNSGVGDAIVTAPQRANPRTISNAIHSQSERVLSARSLKQVGYFRWRRNIGGHFINLFLRGGTGFVKFPGIKAYMDGTIRFARENGHVQTLFGRRIHTPEINAKGVDVYTIRPDAVVSDLVGTLVARNIGACVL